jgi:hypothetical protein
MPILSALLEKKAVLPVVGLWPSRLGILAKTHFLNSGLNNLHFMGLRTCQNSEEGGPWLKSTILFADKVLRNALHGAFRGRSGMSKQDSELFNRVQMDDPMAPGMPVRRP